MGRGRKTETGRHRQGETETEHCQNQIPRGPDIERLNSICTLSYKPRATVGLPSKMGRVK